MESQLGEQAVAKGHDAGLLKTILSQFGKVVGADGSLTFHYDVDRAGRITWKLVQGIYFAEVERFLPENLPKRLFMLGQREIERVTETYPFWPLVRDTEPMGVHGAVFDYKLLCVITDGVRAHIIAMALWDGMLVLVLFHDPTCPCPSCEEARLDASLANE